MLATHAENGAVGNMTNSNSIPVLGATPLPNHGCRFVVWAPSAKNLSVHLLGDKDRVVPMHKLDGGYFQAEIQDVDPEARYFYRFEDGRERPDVASRFQPEGVHGPSQVVDLSDFRWTDAGWKGLELDKSVRAMHNNYRSVVVVACTVSFNTRISPCTSTVILRDR